MNTYMLIFLGATLLTFGLVLALMEARRARAALARVEATNRRGQHLHNTRRSAA